MASQPDIILLNPPADRIVIRDNYCSKVSQAAYINHPVDLVIQSGFLSQYFNLHILDCIIEKISKETCKSRIRSIAPLAVFALCGNAQWNQDIQFLADIHEQNSGMKIIVSGDVFLENPEAFLKTYPFLDAIVTDFTSDSLLRYLRGSREGLTSIVFRDKSGIIDCRRQTPPQKEYSIPIPLHELFIDKDYRYPFVLSTRFATVMTEYGCPYKCAFCVMGTLGHKLRPVENVMEELTALQKLGIRDIFFIDQSFGSDRERNIALCKTMREQTPGLRWVCFSRVDLVDEQILRTMKSAGCHTIIFGVETAHAEMLEKYRKGYTLDQVRSIFALMKKMKIRSVATFLLGLPGETWDSACETIAFARKLNCDFASINIAVPRMGTDLRKWALEKGYIDPVSVQFDQSGQDIVMETETLTREQLRALKQKAIREIYFRPGYLIKRLFAIRSLDELRIQVREGANLIRNFLLNNEPN